MLGATVIPERTNSAMALAASTSEEDEEEAKVIALAQAVEDELRQLKQLAEEIRASKALALAKQGGEAEAPTSSPRGDTKDQKLVHVELSVKSLFHLDTVEQTFGVHLGVTMMWRLPAHETPPNPMEDDGDWQPEWSPKYRIIHEMAELTKETMYSVKIIDGKRWIHLEADHLVDVYEQLELQAFPSDLQDLTIELQSKTPVDRVLWLPPLEKPRCARMLSNKFYLQDFSLLKFPFVCGVYVRKGALGERNFSHAVMKVKVGRKAMYYMLNINLMVFLVCLFALLPWAIHPADIAARHDTDFIIILATVALNLDKTEMLPRLSYVTTLDTYMMMNIVMLIVITVSHFALPLSIVSKADMSPLTLAPDSLEEEQALIDADTLSFYAFSIWMFVFNVAYVVYFQVKRTSDLKSFVKLANAEQKEYDEETLALRSTYGLDAKTPG